MSTIHDDLVKESQDADRRGDGWTADVCRRAVEEIAKLTNCILEAEDAAEEAGRPEGERLAKAIKAIADERDEFLRLLEFAKPYVADALTIEFAKLESGQGLSLKEFFTMAQTSLTEAGGEG